MARWRTPWATTSSPTPPPATRSASSLNLSLSLSLTPSPTLTPNPNPSPNKGARRVHLLLQALRGRQGARHSSVPSSPPHLPLIPPHHSSSPLYLPPFYLPINPPFSPSPPITPHHLPNIPIISPISTSHPPQVRICLHHSSVPYSAAPAPVTEAEVLEAQQLWADQIAAISKVSLGLDLR